MRKKKEELDKVPLIPKEILDIPAGELMTTNFLDISNYVNNHRAIPSLYDGCKDAFRRLIYAAELMYNSELQPAVKVVQSVASWHPHDLKGIEGTAASFYHSGIFSGEGMFGSISMDGMESPHASLRYLKISLSPKYKKLIGDLLSEVMFVESPVGAKEPTYIPFPLPISLIMKKNVEGIANGVKVLCPSFNPWSMYQAYINNDPSLLEPNINIGMDKASSQLQDIWEKGRGSITYYYNVTRCTAPDGRSEGVLFTGDTWYFTPKLKEFDKWVEERKVYIDDLTDINGPKLFIGRVPGARGITVEDIEEKAKKICFTSIKYNIFVTTGMTSYPIPLKEWIGYTYKNYINLVTKHNTKNIKEVELAIRVQEITPKFVKLIMSKPDATEEEIIDKLGIDSDILNSLLNRKLSSLRKNSENETIMKSLYSKLETLKNFDPIKFTEEIIQKI